MIEIFELDSPLPIGSIPGGPVKMSHGPEKPRFAAIAMLREFKTRCPYCGEALFIEVDLSAGMPQEFSYDCTVCCRPAVASVKPDFREAPVLRLRSEDDVP